MKPFYRTVLIVVLLITPFLIDGVMAQGPPVGGTPPCWPPPCIPIDGGLGLLIAAGAMLGGKKALDLKRASSDQN